MPFPLQFKPGITETLRRLHHAREEAAKTAQQIISAEKYLKRIGLRSARLYRLGRDSAKIQVLQKEMYLAVAQSAKIQSYFSGLGLRKVFLDLEEIKWQSKNQ